MTEGPDTRKLSAAKIDKSNVPDPEFERQMALAREIMTEDHELLRKLAES